MRYAAYTYTAFIDFIVRFCGEGEGYDLYDMTNPGLVKLWLKPLVSVNFYSSFNVFLFPEYVNMH